MKIVIGAEPTSGLYSWQQPREGAQSVPAWVRLGPLPKIQGEWTDDHYTALQTPPWKGQRGGQELPERAFLRLGPIPKG